MTSLRGFRQSQSKRGHIRPHERDLLPCKAVREGLPGRRFPARSVRPRGESGSCPPHRSPRRSRVFVPGNLPCSSHVSGLSGTPTGDIWTPTGRTSQSSQDTPCCDPIDILRAAERHPRSSQSGSRCQPTNVSQCLRPGRLLGVSNRGAEKRRFELMWAIAKQVLPHPGSRIIPGTVLEEHSS